MRSKNVNVPRGTSSCRRTLDAVWRGAERETVTDAEPERAVCTKIARHAIVVVVVTWRCAALLAVARGRSVVDAIEDVSVRDPELRIERFGIDDRAELIGVCLEARECRGFDPDVHERERQRADVSR